jgi:PAS domain S-box-containing protein
MTRMRNLLRRLFVPSIFEDEEKTRTAQILNTFGWVAFVIVLLITLSRMISGEWLSISSRIFLPFVLFVLFVTQVLIRYGKVRIAGWFMVTLVWVGITYQASQSDGLRDVVVLAYSILVLLAALMLGRFAGVLTGVLSLITVWTFAFQENIGLRSFSIDPPLSYARDFSAIFVITSVLTYILIQRLNRSLSDAKLELRERLRADEKLQMQANYLTALHETTFGLLNRLELNPLLESILTRAGELLETPHISIDLTSRDGSTLRQEIGTGVFKDWNGIYTQKGEGLTGKVWERGETIHVNEYELWEGKNPEAEGIGFCSIVGTPLKSRNRVLGVLIIASTEMEKQFSLEQVALLEKFAALASLAIDNARLYEEAQRELEERKAVEEDLRSSDERFRKVFNNSNVAISIVTLEDGIFLEANDAFWELTNLTPAQALGRSAVEMSMWENPDQRLQFVKDLLEKGSLENLEVDFPDGKSALAYYELISIKNQRCILCMFYDVSKQRQVQRELGESERRTRAIIASIPDMIFEISKEGELLDFMASAGITPVMAPHEFIGKNIKELFPPRIAQQTMFSLERALATGQVHAFEYGLPPGEEIQFFEARVAPVTTESAIIMVRDISQRKWVETEREKLIGELEDKNSELERFTYTVSHDLKSPVITIRGFLGFLEQDALNGNMPRLKSDIQRISDATDKMQTLLNELLELSRVGRLVNPPKLVPFREIVYEALDLVQGRIQTNNVQVHVQDEMDSVYVDRQRMVEAVQNLIDNAAKFVDGNPKVEIGQTGKEENMPIFFIRDNGVGIPAMHHERIFGLFNKLDAASEGTGIGLALVRRIVEIHKGRIWVQSEPGKGSTFFFTLPAGPES